MLVHLVVVEKVFKEQSSNKQVTGTVQHYKHNYYNQVLAKLNKQLIKPLHNNKL